jgi:integrase
MSPVRTSQGGNYRFDRDFSRIGVGRIQISSGTDKLPEFRRRDGILAKLADNAQIEVLRALKTGSLSIEELVAADRSGTLNSSLSDMSVRRPLWPTVAALLPQLGQAKETRRRYAVSLQALAQKACKHLPKDARVSDLTSVPWAELKARWGGSGADWNHMRRALSTLLSTLLGDKYHPFRRQVMQAIPLANEGPGRVPDLTPEDFWHIVDAMVDHARPCIVTLVATGMRVGEYLHCTKENLRPATLGVFVPGTKTGGSQAVVQVAEWLWPWIDAGIPSPLQYKWLREYWLRACRQTGHSDLRLHDLRHCHGQWAINEGVPEAKVQVSLRHSTAEMTRRYTRQQAKGEVAAALGTALGRRAAR